VRGQIAIPADEVIVATIGGASTRYVQVQGQILAQYEAGAWAYVLPDALGSMRQLVGDAGQVTLAQGYDPLGVLISQSTDLPISQSPHLLAIRGSRRMSAKAWSSCGRGIMIWGWGGSLVKILGWAILFVHSHSTAGATLRGIQSIELTSSFVLGSSLGYN
jgi:hypothetical protein